ncbi:MAG: membrane protein [Mucilaginibacter sp.]
MAQSTATTSSPYSKFGLGDIIPEALPQSIGMGGIGAAVNRISGYNNINVLNPASYGAIGFTTIDAGIYSNVVSLNQTGQPSSTNANFRLSHVAFAIPVSKRSALSFGLLPYSQMGYNYKQTLNRGFGTGSPADTNTVNYIYNGDGGLSKAYLGYGFGLGKHLLIGANVAYIFGNLQQYSSTEIPALYGTLNSKVEQSNAVGGLTYDYGAQYSFDFGEQKQKHLILGYSASANSRITTTSSYIVSHYTYDGSGNQNLAIDSVINQQGAKSKIQLPQINHFGITFQNDLKFLIGADYTIGKWSNLTISGANAGFQDSKTLNVGGQFTPNINALHNYFARTDYRLGLIYDQTYLNLNNTNIKRYAVTVGLGLPLAPNNLSFYKVNFSAEIGQRGTLTNGLVKENYVNLHLGFTLNDKWFQRYKFD